MIEFHDVCEDAGIDVTQDNIEEIMHKLYEWLCGDSPLAVKYVEEQAAKMQQEWIEKRKKAREAKAE